jgi:hypothetical protein
VDPDRSLVTIAVPDRSDVAGEPDKSMETEIVGEFTLVASSEVAVQHPEEVITGVLERSSGSVTEAPDRSVGTADPDRSTTDVDAAQHPEEVTTGEAGTEPERSVGAVSGTDRSVGAASGADRSVGAASGADRSTGAGAGTTWGSVEQQIDA